MGVPGLVSELGLGDRISLAKFCIDHLARHSRPPRVAIDVSIWLYQAQAGRGGFNPELRTLFYRLTRLVALPVHPLFVFDGLEKPEYKRGKAVYATGNAAAHVISLAKRLIEIFRFPWHAAPGEAEAECAKLQTEGMMDAVMSDDIDAIMFGSRVTLRNFSKEASSGTNAATHVNAHRTTATADGEANVSLDQGGMLLFAMLSGGDYLPAGVSKCGPKLAAEIARAGFGTYLLEIVRDNESGMEQKLEGWREGLRHELQTNDSRHFRCKHKAVQIPDSFPDPRVLFDYAFPVTSNRSALKKGCGSWVWDREPDIQELRAFVCKELGWNYSLGAKRLIRTMTPQIISQRLRLCSPISPGHTGVRILNERKSFGLDGMSELKVRFTPADVVDLDVEPVSSQESDLADVDEADPEADQEGSLSASRSQNLKSYDPTQLDSSWILEDVVRIGLPDLVISWRAEQEKKKSKPRSTKPKSRKAGPKVLDPDMLPGSILRFGTIVKGPINTTSSHATPVQSEKASDFANSYHGSLPSNTPGFHRETQGVNPEIAAIPGRTTVGARSECSTKDMGTGAGFGYYEEGILCPHSRATEFRDPNSIHSRSIEGLETALASLHLSPKSNPKSKKPSSKKKHPTSSRATGRTAPTISPQPGSSKHQRVHTSGSSPDQHTMQSSTTENVTERNISMDGQGTASGVVSRSSTRDPRLLDQALPEQSCHKNGCRPSGTRKRGDTRGTSDAPEKGSERSLPSASTAGHSSLDQSPTDSTRISGIIETHNGTWTYLPKTAHEDTNSTHQAVGRVTGTSVNRKTKRYTRVSILDLT